MIKVMFDGKCPLCSKEINYYKRIAPPEVFDWLDIASNPELLKEFGISQITALKRLHVQNEKGEIKIGVDAFISIWRELSYWRILAWLVQLPLIHSLAQIIYNRFAEYRFSKLAHCSTL